MSTPIPKTKNQQGSVKLGEQSFILDNDEGENHIKNRGLGSGT
jgi:hypothetical protein